MKTHNIQLYVQLHSIKEEKDRKRTTKNPLEDIEYQGYENKVTTNHVGGVSHKSDI